MKTLMNIKHIYKAYDRYKCSYFIYSQVITEEESKMEEGGHLRLVSVSSSRSNASSGFSEEREKHSEDDSGKMFSYSSN